MGGGKNLWLRHVWRLMPVGAHKIAYAALVGHGYFQLSVEAILSHHHLISILHWYHCYSRDFGVSKMPYRKADQLTFNI